VAAEKRNFKIGEGIDKKNSMNNWKIFHACFPLT
jgi:hypothetical protein